MKILWVDFTLPYLLKDTNYPVGGWAVELRSWLDGMDRIGNSSGILTWTGANEFVGKEFDFELIETYDPNKGPKVLKYFLTYIPAMQRAVQKAKPDVIIQACASAMTGMAAYVAGRQGIPFVYRVANDMDVDERYKTRLKPYEQLMYRYGLGRSTLVLCQNQYQFDAIAKNYPQKAKGLIPNPYSIPEESPLSPISQRRYVAWLGVFQKQKNLPLLARIAESLPQVPFRIAGTRSKTLDAVTEGALGVLEKLNNVEFVGYLKRDEVMPFLGNAAALLNTSHYEGFSNTYLEAFSNGTPVIAPRGADPDGIIGKLNLGRSVVNEEEFRPAILEILELGDSFRDLSTRCQAYVRKRHDPASLANQVMELVQPLVQEISDRQQP